MAPATSRSDHIRRTAVIRGDAAITCPLGRASMFELKLLSKEGIPGALAKAERYRFFNEPGEAESIYLDILLADPDNQEALVGLLLALTDQFEQGVPGIVHQ